MLFPVRCKGCGRPGTALCTLCICTIGRADKLSPKLYAVFDYGHPIVRASIKELKYHRKSEAARALAAAALPYLVEHLNNKMHRAYTEPLILVPIPSYKAKVRDRGFNQSALIAAWWKESLPQATIKHCLSKTTATLPQAHLNRRTRLQNLAGVMQASTVVDPNSIYVVVDDVITTGATCAEAMRALSAAGAHKIHCVALAHGYARS